MRALWRQLPVLAWACAGAAFAQPASAPAGPAVAPIEFRTVAEALAALRARDGNGTIVTQAEGWTTINEPMAAAQWSFTPTGHEAHPALVRRIIRRGPGATTVHTSSLCEAAPPACTRLLADFAAMNDRITQAVKARGRQGSTQP